MSGLSPLAPFRKGENWGRGFDFTYGVEEFKNLKNFWAYARNRVERESGLIFRNQKGGSKVAAAFSLVVVGGWVRRGETSAELILWLPLLEGADVRGLQKAVTQNTASRRPS